MGELTLLLLKLGFLLLLWAFVFSIVYALRTDLFGDRVRKAPAGEAPAPRAGRPAEPHGAPAPSRAARLVITGGPKAGLEIPLDGDSLTIGRASDSDLVIRDDYTSTHHARLTMQGGTWMIEDLDSTNGTYLDGRRIDTTSPVAPGTPVKVGTTTFELRR